MAFTFLGKFFGRTTSEAAGYGLGGALTRPLDPLLQELTNQTWDTAVAAGIERPLEPGIAAEVAAEDVNTVAWAKAQASQLGYSGEQMDNVIGAVLNAPGMGELLQMWRRKLIDTGTLVHGFRKARLETEWDAALQGLHDVLLSSQELALAQQQGFMEEGAVNAEADLQGVTEARQQIRYELAGLPPGIAEALVMLRRGIIDEALFTQIVREGHTKTKYTPKLLELKAQILNQHDATTLRLKGHITAAQSYAIGALNGFDPATMDSLYLAAGRPAAPGQMTTAVARGFATEADFLLAIKESDIRPEYGPLLYNIRYKYPPLFQMIRLHDSGRIDTATAHKWTVWQSYDPAVADALFGVGTTAAAAAVKKETEAHLAAEYEAGHLTEAAFTTGLEALGYDAASAAGAVTLADFRATKKYRDKAIDRVGTRYQGLQLTDAEAQADLAALNVPATAIALYLRDWQLLRDDEGTTLTKGQAKKAYAKGLLPLADTLARLGDLGMAPADAQLYLDEG